MYLMFKMEVNKILEMTVIQFYNANDNFDTKKGLVVVRPKIGQSCHDRIEAELAGLGLIVLLADVFSTS